MISAGDFRNGVTVEIDGQVLQIIEFQHVKPGKGAAFVRTKLKNVISGGVVEKTFRPTEKFPSARVDRIDMQYLYYPVEIFRDIRLSAAEKSVRPYLESSKRNASASLSPSRRRAAALAPLFAMRSPISRLTRRIVAHVGRARLVEGLSTSCARPVKRTVHRHLASRRAPLGNDTHCAGSERTTRLVACARTVKLMAWQLPKWGPGALGADGPLSMCATAYGQAGGPNGPWRPYSTSRSSISKVRQFT